MTGSTARFGFYTALTAFIAAAGYGVVQLLQVMGLLHPPLDEILIYSFSLGIALPYLFALLALHHSVSMDQRLWSHAALLLGLLYAGVACVVYVVQLGAVIPRTIRGEAEAIAVIRLTEHSFFWVLDALAYILMGLSTLFIAVVFSRRPDHRLLCGFSLANSLMTPVIALVYFNPQFSIGLLMLASPWIITAPGTMLLLARYFKKSLDETRRELYIERELFSRKILTKAEQ